MPQSTNKLITPPTALRLPIKNFPSLPPSLTLSLYVYLWVYFRLQLLAPHSSLFPTLSRLIPDNIPITV